MTERPIHIGFPVSTPVLDYFFEHGGTCCLHTRSKLTSWNPVPGKSRVFVSTRGSNPVWKGFFILARQPFPFQPERLRGSSSLVYPDHPLPGIVTAIPVDVSSWVELPDIPVGWWLRGFTYKIPDIVESA